MKIFTIGFTKHSAEQFFSLLKASGARRIVDVRLNNVSQLAGFAKMNDLKYFSREICGMEYIHVPALAPTQSMLDAYKKRHGQWVDYENEFLDLLRNRRIETSIPREIIDEGCLLCSEATPEHCHRRLVAEYLQQHWDAVGIVHL